MRHAGGRLPEGFCSRIDVGAVHEHRHGRAAQHLVGDAAYEEALGPAPHARGQCDQVDGALTREAEDAARDLIAYDGVDRDSCAGSVKGSSDVLEVLAGARLLLLGPAREEFERRALTPQRETPIKAAELGPDAGMIGASILGLEELAASGAVA